MTVILVLLVCAIFLSIGLVYARWWYIDALYGKKLIQPVKKENLGPGITYVPELIKEELNAGDNKKSIPRK